MDDLCHFPVFHDIRLEDVFERIQIGLLKAFLAPAAEIK